MSCDLQGLRRASQEGFAKVEDGLALLSSWKTLATCPLDTAWSSVYGKSLKC